MKIGILTYFSAHNYGAFLQAYALQKTLSEYSDCDVELINYRSPKEIEFYKMFNKLGHLSVFNYKGNIKASDFYKKRFSTFEQSITKYQTLSDEKIVTSSIDEFNTIFDDKYDVIVVGSDEIWKVDNFRGFPNVYWLPDTKCRKVSFAASARNNIESLDNETITKIQKYVSEFDYIGVRDTATKNLIESLDEINGKCFLNCDPTFLYNFHPDVSDGKAILRDKFKVNTGKKVVGLMMGDESFAKDIIKTYSNKFEFISLYHYCDGSKMYPELTPFEWVNVISAVDGMITTFFHATVFSIKSNTKFLSIDERSASINESKIYDLLSRNNITDGHFLMLNNDKKDELLLREIGSFLADVQDDSKYCNFAEICHNEIKRAESFFNSLGLKKKTSVMGTDDRDCYSCGLCANICPTGAIKMEPDSEGFYRPVVNDDKCINCGLCKNQCINDYSWGGLRIWQNKPKAYGFKHNDEDIRKSSRSGGFFTLVSDFVLENDGAVYGSAFNNGMNVEHIRATDKDTRNLMRGSKYVQSPSFHLFEQIKKDLENGLYVLYSGLPCQVAAVKAYLKNTDCDRLILIDILCHGVPSTKIWKDYISYAENKLGGKITEFDFRNKSKFGWRAHVETFKIGSKEFDSSIYTDMFYDHNILNKACAYCNFKSIDRVSDITLGDFWGIDKAIDGFNDNKGVSLVLVNSAKGQALFDKLTASALYCVEVPIESCMQNSMKKSYPLPEERKRFWTDYEKYGLSGLISRKEQREKIDRVKRIPVRCLSKIKRIIKRILL